jgi:hypothetical protein
MAVHLGQSAYGVQGRRSRVAEADIPDRPSLRIGVVPFCPTPDFSRVAGMNLRRDEKKEGKGR